jgi:hypothetical protein
MIDKEQKKIALIGTGKAADTYVEWSRCTGYDVFTTAGTGQYREQNVQAISSLNVDDYSQVIIASQYLDDIVQYWLQLDNSTDKLYWFDFLYLRLGYVPEMEYQVTQEQSSLIAVYDLSVLPVSFDIAAFLIQADIRRQELDLESITLVIKSGNFGGLSPRAFLSHGANGGNWRVIHVLIPMAQLLPSCQDILFISDEKQLLTLRGDRPTFPKDITQRADFHSYALAPLNQYAKHGTEVRLFTAPGQARIFVEQFLNANHIREPFVCISLREYQHQTSRNSNLDLYCKLATLVNKRGIKVVVIRDTNMAMSEPLGWQNAVECPAASFDIALRLAMYEAAMLNVSVSSGPSCGLMMLSSKVDYMLTHIVDETQWLSNEEFLKNRQDIRKHEQLEFSGEFQKICWATDAEGIAASFEKMLEQKMAACIAS